MGFELTSAPLSSELQKLFVAAKDIATNAGRDSTSCDLLMAMLLYPNDAFHILHEQGVDLEELVNKLKESKPVRDASAKDLEREVRQMAGACGAIAAEPTHLFSVLLRNKASFARTILESIGLDSRELWNAILINNTGSSLLPRTARASFNAGRHYGLVDRSVGGPVGTGATSGPMVAAVTTRVMNGNHLKNPVSPARESSPPIVARPEPDRPISSAQTQDKDQSRNNPFLLSATDFPVLTAIGKNLTQQAADGMLDPVVHRDDAIEQILDIISKRRSNNPCLIGDSGVGKTAIVEGLAIQLVREHATNKARDGANPTVIIAIESGSLFAGTYLRGSLNERITALRAEVKKGDGKIIIFFDQIHALLGAGDSNSNYADAIIELKSALSQGEFPCIGITTPEEYQKYVEMDPSLARAFEPIFINEPSCDEACDILNSLLPKYEAHHGIKINGESASLAVRLTSRFLPERSLPEKAISVVDLAAARASRRKKEVLEPSMIGEVVASQINVPVEKLLMSDEDHLLNMEAWIGQRLIGHKEEVSAIARAVRRNQVGFRGKRPIGSFLFLGSTGVGKTECAKVLAEFLFHDRNSLTRIDMSEYMESHSVARLIGAPPGYIGHMEGGQLTDVVRRRPYQLILFDEIEKAHSDVLNILLQILEEGCLTDARGKTVDFSNTLIILTSNLGAAHFKRPAVPRNVGFVPMAGGEGGAVGYGHSGLNSTGHWGSPADKNSMRERVFQDAKAALSPELWNRFDDKLLFFPLAPSEIIDICSLLLSSSKKQLFSEKQIDLIIDEGVPEWLMNHGGYEPELGARPLRRAINQHLEAPLAELILSNAVQPGDVVKVCTQEPLAPDVARMRLSGDLTASLNTSPQECLIFQRALI